MLSKDDINIIFDEGPFSRSYLALLTEMNIKISNLIIINKYFLIKNYFVYKKFLIRNHFPIKALKDKNLKFLIHQIEDYFGFNRDFIKKIYSFKNLYLNHQNFKIINSDKINAKELMSVLEKIKPRIFLNTSKQILKDILYSKHNFVHIHPGYLPHVRGMDGSLWNIKIRNKIGVTSFIMDRGIDTGDIIFKEEFDLPKFKFPNSENYTLYEKYNIWFSFFDPLLRTQHLKKILNKNFEYNYNYDNDKLSISNNLSNKNYFKKIDKDSLNYVFSKVFI